MSMGLERLASGLFFLSCDGVPPFADALFVPSRVVVGLRPELRSVLGPRLEEGFIGVCDINCEVNIARILRDLENSAGKDLVDLSYDWIGQVYALSADDRAAEMNWSFVLSVCQQEGFQTSVRLSTQEAITKMWQQFRSHYSAIKEEVETRFPEGPSAWDLKLKPGLFDDWTDVKSTVLEIIRYNQFLLAWEHSFSRASFEQLQDIRRWGDEATQFLGQGSIPLPYPGAWRYGCRRFFSAREAESGA